MDAPGNTSACGRGGAEASSSWHFGLGRRMLVTIPLASAGGGWRWHRSVTASFAHSELHSGSSRRHHPRYIHSVSASRPSRRSSHPASPSLDIISAFHYPCRTFHIDTQSPTQWPNRWRESRFRPQKSTSHRRQTNSRNVWTTELSGHYLPSPSQIQASLY